MRIECVTRSEEKEINYEMRKEKVERQEEQRLDKWYLRRTHQIR